MRMNSLDEYITAKISGYRFKLISNRTEYIYRVISEEYRVLIPPCNDSNWVAIGVAETAPETAIRLRIESFIVIKITEKQLFIRYKGGRGTERLYNFHLSPSGTRCAEPTARNQVPKSRSRSVIAKLPIKIKVRTRQSK